MSAKWRVYNRHPQGLTHKEKFRERIIEIPAGDYVVMDYEEAVQFRGQYFPMKKNAQGAPDPASYKCIVLEPHSTTETAAAKPTEFICHFDGKKFPTQKMLDEHIEANYSDKIVKDEALDEEIAKEEKRKRGRPAKEQTA